MQNEQILDRIENLRRRKLYEEKKPAKLGFASMCKYFEDKVAKETKAIEVEQVHKTKLKKAIKAKVAAKKAGRIL
ncbi:hypothetical protein OA416_02005 [Paracoccaceae bacterium]|nr:hypothetical protein [Paracoccaceae bacterium]